MAFLMISLPYLALLGLLLLVLIAVAAYFWPTIEWRLLCWLQTRRRTRETRGPR